MQRSISRRVFLGQTGLAAAGLGAGALWAGRGGAAEPAPKKLIVGCREAMLAPVDQVHDSWTVAKAVGADGIEVSVHGEDMLLPQLFTGQDTTVVAKDKAGKDQPVTKRGVYSIATPDDVARLQADVQAAGLRITAFCMHNQFDVRPDDEIAWALKTAQTAQLLGTPAIRIDVWPRKLPREAFLDFAVATMKKLISVTEATGVKFAIENHGTTTNDPAFLRPLFARVDSPRLGLTLDTGNFYWYGHPLSKLYDLYAEFAPRVFHTHCKSIKYPPDKRDVQRPMGWEYAQHECPIYEGDIDFRRVVDILRKAGFTGDLCVENEGLNKFKPEERCGVLAREIKLLKELA